MWTDNWVGKQYGEHLPVSERRFCWDFVREVFTAERKIVLPEYKGVYADSLAKEQQEELAQAYTAVPFAAAQEWDLVWMMLPPSRIHVGVVIRRGQMIHAGVEGEVELARYDLPPYSNWTSSILRVTEVS